MSTRAAKRAKRLAQDVYRGYMPIGLPQHRPPTRIKPWWKVLGKPRHDMYPKSEVEEYSEEPEYPPLNDATREGLRSRVRHDWYESLKKIPTADEKLYEINKHATHRIAHIKNWSTASHPLPFSQYLTQTHVIKSLPSTYALQTNKEESSGPTTSKPSVNTGEQFNLDSRIEQIVLEQIIIDKFESQKNQTRQFISKSIRDKNRKAYISNTLVQNIFNHVKKALVCSTNSQLLYHQIDSSPAIRSWWYHSGFLPTNNKVFWRSRKDDDGNVNTIFQMDGSSALNIRSEHLIEPILDLNDPLVTDTSLIQPVNIDPRYYGADYKFKWPVALPGFWFEDKPRYDCPHTCFLTMDSLTTRKLDYRNLANEFIDQEDFLTSQAVLTAFGWLNSLSMYHGYTPYDELDYPLTCQVVTTDGQNWLFNVYQLNSHTFHRDLGGPKRNNVCWSSGMLKLFDNYSDGKFEGLNSDVLKTLTKFLSTQVNANYTQSLNLRPLLGEDTRSQEQKDETRQLLRRTFEGRMNRWKQADWWVPQFEHIFFRAKESRHQIRHMKPKWHTPKPPYPKIFD